MSAGEAGSGAGEYGPDAGDDNMTAEALEEVKIVVVGDGAVGKTCLCHVFVKREFPHGYEPTIFENYTEIVDVANKVRLNKLILKNFGSECADSHPTWTSSLSAAGAVWDLRCHAFCRIRFRES